jgi:hypothetical protein
MAKKRNPPAKKAATKKVGARPSVKGAAAKTSKAKSAGAPRGRTLLAAAEAAPTPALQVFTGTVSLNDSALTVRLDGTLMTMDTTSCSRQGVIDAHAAFRGKDGQQASVQGFEWDCEEAVIHITRILS